MTPSTEPTASAPSSARALRFVALGGFLALFASLVLTTIVVLEDAIAGDGRGGPAVGAAFWALGLGAVLGLVAAVPPRAALAHGVRKGAVLLQYTLAVIAPLFALMD
ncbi:hypothetical protein [Streptomyces sp. NPDC006551]|uniref:hypothetical protein n=1 Tax=Streptomyces sp. NPDC006551 TaxID=3157178 RepID=UPI0033B982D7